MNIYCLFFRLIAEYFVSLYVEKAFIERQNNAINPVCYSVDMEFLEFWFPLFTRVTEYGSGASSSTFLDSKKKQTTETPVFTVVFVFRAYNEQFTEVR